MDNRVYLWLFNNINKYTFYGEQANRVKAAISGLLVTEATINSDVIVAKMQEQYMNFVNLFYNNIFGYKNGLASKPIVAAELDCYLVETSDGPVPIGYYREIRPAETVTMVQQFLEQCQDEVNEEKNSTVARWQSALDSITANYERIKNDRNPNMFKVVLGVMTMLLAAALLLFFVICLFTPLGRGVAFTAITSVLMIAVAIVMLVLTVKEVKLISAKKTTTALLTGMLSNVNALEQGIANDMAVGSNVLFDSARQGINAQVVKNANASLIDSVEKKIGTATLFVNKPKSKRNGLPGIMVIFALIICVLCSSLYILPSFVNFEDIFNTSSTNGGQKGGTNTIYGNGGNGGYVEPEEKVSSYKTFKSDATWYDAQSNAEAMGGYLVSINDREEFDKVCSMAENMGIQVFWVGAKRATYESWDEIKWQDGEDIDFTQWFAGEPTYQSEDGMDEEFLMVFSVDGIWYFNDAISDVAQYYTGRMGYIVEIEE